MVRTIETETDETALRDESVQAAWGKRDQLRVDQTTRTLRLHQPKNHPRFTPQVIAGGVDEMNDRDHEAIFSSLAGQLRGERFRGMRRSKEHLSLHFV